MTIERLKVGARMSQAVIHGEVVYLSGQVARNAPGEPAAAQTRDILAAIDALLEAAGTDKSRLLTANIWLADMKDFAEMNEVWDAWVVVGHTPARACVESRLAAQQYTVEIAVTAAVA
ncbi:MAG: RidA family protein [Pseudomonadales bacterium]